MYSYTIKDKTNIQLYYLYKVAIDVVSDITMADSKLVSLL